MSTQRQLIDQWMQQNPNLVRGLQSAIGGAEGAGYNTMFGGGKFQSYGRHPGQVVRSGGYASDAAGRYQFLSPTWNTLQKQLGLPDFSPRSQDTAMVAKVRERLMPVGGLAALSKAGTLTPELQAQLAPEWASFPTAAGVSYYGQPVKKASQIQQWFDKSAQGAPRVASNAPSSPPPPVPAQQQKAQDFLSMAKEELLKSVLQPGTSVLNDTASSLGGLFNPTGLFGVTGLFGPLDR